MAEPNGLGARAALLVLAPVVTSIRDQWKRRGAQSVAGEVAAPNTGAFNEALDTLSLDPFNLQKAIVHVTKRALSDVPVEFSDDEVRLWLQRDDIRGLIVTAARASLAGQESESERQVAIASFRRELPDSRWTAEDVVDLATAFLVLTVGTKLTPGDRTILDVSVLQHEQLIGRFGKLEDLLTSASAMPSDAINEFLDRHIVQEERLRSLVDDERANRLSNLASRVLNGDLRAASDACSVALFRAAAGALARDDRFDEAEDWIEHASARGANDLAPDRARVAMGRGDYDRVFALVGKQRDPLSVLLVANSLKLRDGPAAGAEYLTQNMDCSRLSGFGLSSLGDWLARAGEWARAEATLETASDDQCQENPMLPYLRMRVRVALMLPDNLRDDFFHEDHGLPLVGHLRSDTEGLRLRAAAVQDLEFVADQLRELDPERREWIEAQLLYLRLIDRSDTGFEVAAREARTRAETPQSAIQFAPIAEIFDIKYDRAVVDQEQMRRAALGGGLKSHDVIAAYQLIGNRGDADEMVAFTDQHQAALLAAGTPLKQIVSVKIEALARAGRPDDARTLLDASREELGEAAFRLEAILAGAEGDTAPVEQWRTAFENSDHDVDLANYVEALARTNGSELGVRAVELWHRRHRIEDIAIACVALFNEGRDIELDALLAAVGTDGDHNTMILKQRAWASFRDGRLDDARERTEFLRKDAPDDEGLRQLEINIALEMGRWRQLGPMAHQDLARADQRNAHQLLQAAEFAQIIDDPIAEELARAAVAKDPNNPAILLAAFGFAVRRGTDWGTEAGGWMSGAIQNSGSEGPVQQASLRDILTQSDTRREHAQRLDRMVLDGEIPLELVAEPLGVTLSELFFAGLPRNVASRDARRRMCLPLIAGNRLPVTLPQIETAAFDLPALLLLEQLNLLGLALEAFPTVLLPAGTMPKLFDDFTRAQRGQRSRFAQAERVQRLITDGHIDVTTLAAKGDEELPELALAKERSALYVHDYPIHVPGSLGEEAMDVTHASDVIVSPAALIDALRAQGELDPIDAEAALVLLGSSKARWPEELLVDLSRPLLLNIVALNALDLAGVLPRLVTAGVKLVVSEAVVGIVAGEIKEWRQAQEPLDAIERLRDRLVSAAGAGRLRHGGFRRDGATIFQNERLDRSPLTALFSDASNFDALISGDRMINRYPEITDRHGNKRPIYTVVDIVDRLFQSGAIDQAGRHRARHAMREMGVAFVPIEVEEVVEAAGQGDWSMGASRALRSIVTSVHLPLLRRALVMPDELHCLGHTLAVLTIAIRHCWTTLSIETAPAAASWLLKSIPDSRNCVGETMSPEMSAWADQQRVAMHATLALPIGVPVERQEAYDHWYASLVAPQLNGRDAQLKARVIDALTEKIESARPFETADVVIDAVEVRHWLVQHVPASIRAVMLDDDRVQRCLELGPASLTIAGHAFAPEKVATFCKAALTGQPSPLINRDGEVVATTARIDANGDLLAESAGKTIVLDFAGLFLDDPDHRFRTWDRVVSRATLTVASEDSWRSRLRASPLDAVALSQLVGDLADTPQAWIRRLRAKSDYLTFDELCEPDEGHYELFFEVGSTSSLSDVLARTVAARAAQGNVFEAARSLAPLAVALDFDMVALTASLPDDELAELARRLGSEGDLFSVIAAFAIAASRPQVAPCIAAGEEILELLVGANGRIDDAAHDFAAVAMAVINHADVTGVLRELPLSHRRCALLAHCGLALRGLGKDLVRPAFVDAARAYAGKGFGLAGAVERQLGRWWLREWLVPPALAGLARARLRGILRSVPEGSRPTPWTRLIDLGSEIDVLEIAPGPLDEFCKGWVTQTFPVALLAKGIKHKKADSANRVLFNIIMSLEMPDDLPLARKHVLTLLRRVKGEALAQSVSFALMAASRWRDPELADKAYSLGLTALTASGWTLALGAEWALAAVAPVTDHGDRLSKLESHLGNLVDRKLSSSDAVELIAFFDKLVDLMPEATFLHSLRTRALLAA